jgi:TPR repeat protein
MDRVNKLTEQALFHFYNEDYERAAEIGEILIKEGHAEGYTILGIVYAALGDDEHLNIALNFFEEAAQKGEEVGKFFLGFYTDTLTEKDFINVIYNFTPLSYFILKMLPDFIKSSKNKGKILNAITYSYSLKEIEENIEKILSENPENYQKKIFLDLLELIDKLELAHKRVIKKYLKEKND